MQKNRAVHEKKQHLNNNMKNYRKKINAIRYLMQRKTTLKLIL